MKMTENSETTINFDSESFLATVNHFPGVYIMEDQAGKCLYVGKAKDLRKRLSTYFRKSELGGKVKLMVAQIAKVHIVNTETEGEALLLENSLIKSRRPRYNVVFRDDKSYPYIRITDDQTYPGLSFYRGSLKRSGLFFGPYATVAAVREILSQIQKIVPVRHCSDSYFSNRSRPCLQYQIKRCSAPCVDLVEPEAYKEDIRQVILLLQGRSNLLAELFEKNMQNASEALDYELAAHYRDRISALREIEARQSTLLPHDRDTDVISVVEKKGVVVVSVMFVRFGQNHGNRHYIFRNSLSENTNDVLASFVPQFYLRNIAPKEILVYPPHRFNAALTDLLSEKSPYRVLIKPNVRGRRAQALALCRSQASDYLDRHLSSRESYKSRFKTLCRDLGVTQDAQCIECYDISHTGGESVVAAQIVFGPTGPDVSQYRRFNIRNAQPGDDYGALREVLMRRFRHVLEEPNSRTLPDIVLVDGGKGQLGVAREVINELNIENMFLIGIAKGAGRKPHLDRLYSFISNHVTQINTGRTAMHLVQEIRDEAHRFALTGHRRQRSKKLGRSTLEEIAGIGRKRRQLLLTHFGGLKSIEKAGVEDIGRIKGISPTLAKIIYQHLHS